MLIVIGAVLGFLGVAAGAFGAHGLKEVLEPKMLAVFETGARYHLIHALAIVLLGAVEYRLPPELARRAGQAFLLGVILFSGSLYLLAITGVKWIGIITPIGGIALLAGWAAFASAGWRATREPDIA